MFYVINQEDSEGKKEIALCKTDSLTHAMAMTRKPEDFSKWVCFTEEQVTALLECREGHIVKKL